jgi:hypothetical protein
MAESLIVRNWRALLSTPLLHIQSAPVLFVITVKLIISVFGSGETALRVFSFIMYLFAIAASGFVLYKTFNVEKMFAFLGMCITASFPIYIAYSDMLKPYMSDAFFVLAVLVVYFYYKQGRLKLPAVTAINVFILYFSSPSLFFIAAVYIYEFICAYLKKDNKELRNTVISGAIVLFLFLVYYLWWIRPVADNPGMTNYWKFFRFDILATDGDQIKHNFALIADVFNKFDKLKTLSIVLFIAGFVISLLKKNHYTYIIGIAFVLLLAAAHLEKYPIHERLYNFFYVIVILYNVIFVRELYLYIQKSTVLEKENLFIISLIVYVVFSFILVKNNAVIREYYKDGWYMNNFEANALIDYVKENIKPDEYFYTYRGANEVVGYRCGYGNNRIGDVTNDNIVWGKTIFDWMNRAELNDEIIENQRPWRALPRGEEDNPDRETEITRVRNLKKAYLIFYDGPFPERTLWGLNELTKYGEVREVMTHYGTRLYYYKGN